MQVKELVNIHNGELRCGTWLIGQGFGRKHTKVLELCKKYEKEMMELEDNKLLPKGFIINKIPKKTAGQPVKEYLLNEGQTILLGTLFRAKTGDDLVLRFKVKLAKEFIKQRKMLAVFSSHKQSPEYIKNRAAGKIERREETDTIKDFVDYASLQGSKNAGNYYTNLTTLVNSAMFDFNGKFKNKREAMTAVQLLDVKFADKVVSRGLIEGMAQSLPYSDIFQLVKKRVLALAAMYGKSEILSKQLSLLDDE